MIETLRQLKQIDQLADASRASTAERRILCVVRYPVGGIRTYLYYNYPYLADAGYTFTFVGPQGPEFDAFRDAAPAWRDARFLAAPRSRKRRHRYYFRPTIRHALRSERIRLVHSQGFTSAIDVACAAPLLKVPHAMTSHDVFRPAHFLGHFGPLKRFALSHLVRRHLDALITVSCDAHQNHLTYLPALRRARCRTETILHGIDVGTLRSNDVQARVSIRERLRLDAAVVLLGFCGRFMEQKGFLPLLGCLEQLRASARRPFHVVAVGSGDYEREYRMEVDRRGLSPYVSFLPAVRSIGEVLPQLDVLLIPSLWEAFCLLAVEALIAGTPIVATDCIGLREVLTDTPASIAPLSDWSAFTTQITSAIDSTTTLKAEALAFVPEAVRRYDVKPRAEQLLALCDQLITRPARTVAP